MIKQPKRWYSVKNWIKHNKRVLNLPIKMHHKKFRMKILNRISWTKKQLNFKIKTQLVQIKIQIKKLKFKDKFLSAFATFTPLKKWPTFVESKISPYVQPVYINKVKFYKLISSLSNLKIIIRSGNKLETIYNTIVN